MLRWGLEHGFIVLPKSNRRERQIENAAIFDFALGAEDLAELDALDRSRRQRPRARAPVVVAR